MRTVFLIDGFNFYHALKRTEVTKKGQRYLQKNPPKWKWFNYEQYCRLFLDAKATLVDIYYFTAYCIHKPGSVNRHKLYISVLQDLGVKVVLGKYKKKTRECRQCGNTWLHPEEKATDVNIAIEAYALANSRLVDKIFIVSGDTDLLAVLVRIRKDFPTIKTEVIFPYLRHSSEFESEGFVCHKTTKAAIEASLFPRDVPLKDGSIATRPKEWAF